MVSMEQNDIAAAQHHDFWPETKGVFKTEQHPPVCHVDVGNSVTPVYEVASQNNNADVIKEFRKCCK